MIGLDTNMLARYILQDDAPQAAAASRAIATHCTATSPGFISQLVLIELIWVLTRGYGYPKTDTTAVVTGLLRAAELAVEDSADVWTALRAFEAGGADFADYLIKSLNHRLWRCEKQRFYRSRS